MNSQVVLLHVSLFKKVEQEFTERILEFQAQTLVNSLRAQRVLLKKVRSSVVSIHLICLIYLIFLIYLIYLIYLIIAISSISSILSILLIYLMYLVYLIYLIYLSICVFVYLKDLSLSLSLNWCRIPYIKSMHDKDTCTCCTLSLMFLYMDPVLKGCGAVTNESHEIMSC